MPLRLLVLRRLGHRIGPVTRIRPGTRVFGRGLDAGRDVFINTGCTLDATDAIVIGDEVHLGHGVHILTSTHEVGPSGRRAGAGHSMPVAIGDGVWVGAGAIILPGVAIGGGCVIAAGAVVRTDCTADGMYAGVPARRLRDLP
jgi:maltose O-acetyltransferase